jgi:hypothetical protein
MWLRNLYTLKPDIPIADLAGMRGRYDEFAGFVTDPTLLGSPQHLEELRAPFIRRGGGSLSLSRYLFGSRYELRGRNFKGISNGKQRIHRWDRGISLDQSDKVPVKLCHFCEFFLRQISIKTSLPNRLAKGFKTVH